MSRFALSLVFALLALPAAAFAQAAPAQLTGAVTTLLTLDETTLKALPATTLDVSFETSKGPETGHYTGALLWDLVNKAVLVNDEGKNAALKHTLLITGSDGYAISVALGELDPNFANTQVLLAYDSADGKASFDHLRLVVPGDVHGGRSVKDVVGIEVK